jgi:hypothetical protein
MSKTTKKRENAGEKPCLFKRLRFQLNKNNVAVIVAMLALFGTMVSATFTSVGTILAAVLTNWGKVQTVQAADTQLPFLITYNDQRIEEVNNTLDSAESILQKAKEEVAQAKDMPDQQADLMAIESTLLTVKERQAAINSEYKNLATAIRSEQRGEADVRKTRINKLLNRTQKDINDNLSRPSLEPLRKSIWIDSVMSLEESLPSRGTIVVMPEEDGQA